jgi:sterol desaturase/sphingolipid hydroxylase (fatty acid hydroxylase superfamily)
MTYKDTYKSHYLETIVQSIGIFLPIMFMKFIYLEFIFVLILINIRGMIRHDFNLQWIFGNHHILHHQYGNCNYGEYYLDYIFNTNFTKEKRKL